LSDLADRVVDYVTALKSRYADRDARHKDVSAIRDGDYDSVAPGIFPPEFPRAMVANLIDTAARDISELQAPMPSISCASVSMTSDTAKKFASKRGMISNGIVQRSRLATTRYGGTDRHNTFGFMAYIVEPNFREKSPTIRIGGVPSAYYTLDYFGRCKMYAEVSRVPADVLALQFPEHEAVIKSVAGKDMFGQQQKKDLEVVCYFDKDVYAMVLVETRTVLVSAANPISRCPVSVVERPTVTSSTHGQFDDVIWVQIVRAMIQAYMLQAVEDSVNAPLVVPTGTNQIEMGPKTVLESDQPQNIGRLQLQIPQGVFPAEQVLQQEQLTGSRYTGARTGNIDASIITGQGVQALNAGFDTQIQTFQRLDQLAFADAVSMAFEMDEAVWGDMPKSITVDDSGSPVEVKYTPSKDIGGDHTVSVSYGAIAGLDPNRGLVFVLQALQAQLISRDTAQRSLPIDINPTAEQQKIDVEVLRDALTASIAGYAQAIPAMAAQGGDAANVVMQIAEILKRRQKNDSIDVAVEKVFAAKPSAEETAEPAQPGGPPAQTPSTPGQELLSSLAGLTASGGANLNSTVRMTG
jgi:hypothetical protein